MSKHTFHTVKRNGVAHETRFNCYEKGKQFNLPEYLLPVITYCPCCGENIRETIVNNT